MKRTLPLNNEQTRGAASLDLRRFCAAACIWCCAALGAAGQPAPAASLNTPAGLVAQLQTRLADAQAELVLAQSAQSDAAHLPPGATAAEAQECELMTEMLARVYQEHIDHATRLDEVRQRQADLDQKVNAWSGFAEPPPYSILLVDELRDSEQAFAAKVSSSESTQNVLAALALDAEATLKESDARLRLLAEQLESAKDATRVTRLTWQRTMEQLRNRKLVASVAMDDTRRQRLAVERAQDRQQLAFARRQLAVACQRLRFSRADLDQVLAGLDAERRALDKELAGAEKDFGVLQQGLSAAREELRQALQAVADGRAGQTDWKAEVPRLQALVELRGAQADTGAQRQAVLRRLAEGVISERGLWQVRFATFQTKQLDELREGYRRLDKLDRLLCSVRPYFQQQVELAASRIAEQSNRLQNQSGAQAAPAVAQELLGCYRQQEELADRALRSLERLGRLALRWKEALDEGRKLLPLSDRVRDLFSGCSSFTEKFWDFELFVAQDTITVDGQTVTGRRSVTIGKVVMAFLILAVGYWLAVLFSRLLERVAVKRLKVDPNRASLMRRGVRGVLLVGLVVFSLVSVKIPLTIFAFLGGALAIGLGFGTQTLLKNFISGIIILFDRPFRLGDVLDVGGSRGVVKSIGIHSSVIRKVDGTETLIPNSALLENNLTNWTYTDRKVRFSVDVGVAYGTDTRRVAQLLAEEAERHGLVQKEPPPQVLFKEFGDNAMIFELRYWADVIKHDAGLMGSDLRHMIAGVFAENGIVLAFPQRDIHLDTVRPLLVRIERPAAVLPQTPPD